MPTTRKQKIKAKRSKEADLTCDQENIDVIIGRDQHEKEDSEFEVSTRRAESPNCESLLNHNLNSNSHSKEYEIRRFAENGQLASDISLDNNLDHLSRENN